MRSSETHLSVAAQRTDDAKMQVDFGAVWPHSFAGVLSAKISDAQVRRKIALEGHRFSPQEALNAGIIDHLASGNTAAVLAKAEELALAIGVKAQGICLLLFLNINEPCP